MRENAFMMASYGAPAQRVAEEEKSYTVVGVANAAVYFPKELGPHVHKVCLIND